MMVETYTYITLTLTSLVLYFTYSNASPASRAPPLLVKNLDDVDEKLSDAVQSIDRLRRFLSDEIDACRWSSTDCTMGVIEPMETLIDKLQSSHNPGKRSVRNLRNPIFQPSKYISDMYRKQAIFERIQSKLADFLGAVHGEKKRSCQLNLGFHCQTQEYSAIADMYNYLQTGMSPGKRR